MKYLTNYYEFNNFININRFSIVIAKSKTCSVCDIIVHKLNNILNDYKQLETGYLYIEEVGKFSGQHLVFTVPTVVVFYNAKEVYRESRYINFGELRNQINRIISHIEI